MFLRRFWRVLQSFVLQVSFVFFLKNIFLGMKKLLFIFSRFEKKVFSSLVRFFTPLVAAVFVVVQSSLFALFWLSFIY
tara:strand:- start:10 stop:243 length:234 start_codon:yes stop_codon:yes gene_type:complete